MPLRALWLIALAAIIALGIVSRTLPLGNLLWDKYLGDSLYAAMVYVLLRLFTKANPASLLVTSSAIMVAIEAFQLTGIPAAMLVSTQAETRIAARLLGTHFGIFDLLAYCIGIYLVFEVDRFLRNKY